MFWSSHVRSISFCTYQQNFDSSRNVSSWRGSSFPQVLATLCNFRFLVIHPVLGPVHSGTSAVQFSWLSHWFRQSLLSQFSFPFPWDVRSNESLCCFCARLESWGIVLLLSGYSSTWSFPWGRISGCLCFDSPFYSFVTSHTLWSTGGKILEFVPHRLHHVGLSPHLQL